MTNWQCRVGLVGKWPLEWRRGTGSVTFRWHVIVESKIWAKFFFGGAFPSLKVEQRSWFSAQTFLNYRSFTSRKRIAEWLAETLKFWRNSRRVAATAGKSCQPCWIIRELSKPGRRRQREELGKDCFRISDVFETLLIRIVAQISSVSAKVFISSSSLTTEERLW